MQIDPGWFGILLEAANGDPLRAAEIETHLTQEWWNRYMAYRIAKSEADADEQRKLDRQSRRRH